MNSKLFDLYSDYLLSFLFGDNGDRHVGVDGQGIRRPNQSDAQRPTTGAGRLVADFVKPSVHDARRRRCHHD